MLTTWLEQFKQNSQINLLDIHLALFLSKKSQLTDDIVVKRLAFLILLLSFEVRAGHVCLDISQIDEQNYDPKLWHDLASPTLQDWLTTILQAQNNQIISDGTLLSPLVFIDNRLYFQRMYLDEKQVASYFNQPLFEQQLASQADLITILDQLFTQQSATIDWQKIAVAVALTRKVAIISGGPGTGKTTTVAKILAGILLTNPNSRIIATAPTGKAASRLTESLSQAIAQLPVNQKINIKAEAITLHRLLGAKADNRSFHYNKQNPLHVDVLVIDEASMVDLNMMSRVIDALPVTARLILLGDKDQLSSVEAGAVFGDLCAFIGKGYSPARAQELTQLTGYVVPSAQKVATITDSICLLQKSYRFDQTSGIGVLANAVKEGSVSKVKALLMNTEFNDIHFYNLASKETYQSILNESVEHYSDYLKAIKSSGDNDIMSILAKFANYRLLCALRSGMFGVSGLNLQIESLLAKHKLIQIKNKEAWYIGRPIMILRNSAALGLYNGDIGIALPAEHDSSKLRVYFPFADGSIKGFSPFRLPEHETAYAMTIHKSQGSEFDDVNIILPTDYSPLLNRSLLYTAITRAKKTVSIYADTQILALSVKSQIHRESGLAQQIENTSS